jgi:hypothetical protein
VGALVVLGLLATALSSYHTNFTRDNDPRELLNQAGQATQDVPETFERYEALDQISQAELGEPLRLAIDSSSTWPWPFYFRDATVLYFNGETGEVPDADMVIVTSDNDGLVANQLVGYQPTPILHRWWWVPDYSAGWVSGWAQYMIDRTIWDHPKGLGSVNETVYVRPDLAEIEAGRR